jgi:hypothetical protein
MHLRLCLRKCTWCIDNKAFVGVVKEDGNKKLLVLQVKRQVLDLAFNISDLQSHSML